MGILDRTRYSDMVGVLYVIRTIELMSGATQRNFLTVDPEDSMAVLKGLSSPARIKILRLLRLNGPMNVNEISAALGLPQSTVATNVQVLETAELIRTETSKASKGQQKICSARFDEVVIRLDGAPARA